MRITGGLFKRLEIYTPKGKDTRPCSGITRESIFNILGSSIEGLSVLDLYAGSGSFGFEALSRGASSVLFVENEDLPLKCIKKNAEKLAVSEQIKILKRNLPVGIKSIHFRGCPDLIFLDPPYSKGFVNNTLSGIKKYGLATDTTMIIVEHAKKEVPEESFFNIIDQRKYGKSLISILNYLP